MIRNLMLFLSKINLILLSGIILLWLSGCKEEFEAVNDWAGMGLKGKVRSIKGDCYIAVEEDGEIVKGKRGGSSWRKNFYFVFNEEGKILLEDVYYISGLPQYKSIYSYDEDGRKNEEIIYKANDSLVFVRHFIYDSNNYVIKLEMDYQDGKKPTEWTFVNDELGNRIEEYRHFPDGGKVSVKVFYKYDQHQRKIQEHMYNSEDRQIARWTSVYDKKGLQIEENYYDSVDSFVAKETYFYKFDEQGNWTQQTIFENDQPKYIIERVFSYY